MNTTPPARAVDAWAVLIGINRFDEEVTYSPLRCCVPDAVGLYLLLTHPERGNFDPERVLLLIDGSNTEVRSVVDKVAARLGQDYGLAFRPGVASEVVKKRQEPWRENILAEVDRAARFANRDDLLLVHCSSHGYVFDGAVYLVPPRARHPQYADTAIALDILKEKLRQSRARYRVLILDACYSGSASTGAIPATNEAIHHALFAGTEDIQAFTSCLPWEQCYEHDVEAHGIFTWFLLDGLAGRADDAGRGHVTLEDLHRHVAGGLKRWVTTKVPGGPLQTPSMQAGQAHSVILSRHPGGLPVSAGPNPFVWRAGISEASAFFNREAEQARLQQFVNKRQNHQVVGPRRIGKTSLLRQFERVGAGWEGNPAVANLDLQNPQCYTLAGWLRRAGERLGLPGPPADLAGFALAVEEALRRGARLVLCLDEFEELTIRPKEFTRDFFLTLRSCGQEGLSIITASQRPLSELTDPGDPVVSPFYNTFPLLRLGPFREADAADFVALQRPELPPFSAAEQAAVLRFARGHPLALQVGCYYLVEMKRRGGSPSGALREAEEEMKVLLPEWSAGLV
jgi:hypothetical protein